MASQVELTPCGAMFDIFKRAAHLSHIELCGLVLSSRPLADGRSPQSRAADRSWVSRFIVRAPVGTLQQRYFAEYGTSAARIMSQLVEECIRKIRSLCRLLSRPPWFQVGRAAALVRPVAAPRRRRAR